MTTSGFKIEESSNPLKEGVLTALKAYRQTLVTSNRLFLEPRLKSYAKTLTAIIKIKDNDDIGLYNAIKKILETDDKVLRLCVAAYVLVNEHSIAVIHSSKGTYTNLSHEAESPGGKAFIKSAIQNVDFMLGIDSKVEAKVEAAKKPDRR